MCKLPRNYFCFGNRKIGPCPEFRSYFRRRKSAENKKESKLCTRSCMRFSPIPKSTHIPSNFAPENPRITSIFELWACIKVCWTLLGFFIWLGDPKCNVLLRPFFSFRSLSHCRRQKSAPSSLARRILFLNRGSQHFGRTLRTSWGQKTLLVPVIFESSASSHFQFWGCEGILDLGSYALWPGDDPSFDLKFSCPFSSCSGRVRLRFLAKVLGGCPISYK